VKNANSVRLHCRAGDQCVRSSYLLVEYRDDILGNDFVEPFLERLDLIFNAAREHMHRHQPDILMLVFISHVNLASARLVKQTQSKK
jgi:hypothetical protein